MKTYIHKKTSSRMFIAALFITAKHPSTGGWIKYIVLYPSLELSNEIWWRAAQTLSEIQNFPFCRGAAGRQPLAASPFGEKQPTSSAWSIQSGQNLPQLETTPAPALPLAGENSTTERLRHRGVPESTHWDQLRLVQGCLTAPLFPLLNPVSFASLPKL